MNKQDVDQDHPTRDHLRNASEVQLLPLVVLLGGQPIEALADPDKTEQKLSANG